MTIKALLEIIFLSTTLSALSCLRETPNYTNFFQAVSAGDLKSITFFIAEGTDINRPGSDGLTPLHYAALLNQIEVIRLLVSHGADKSKLDRYGKTPLMLAQELGHTEAAQALA